MANRHLTLSERHCIEDLLRLGYLEAKIAEIIGFSITTIKNELKRNSINGGFCRKLEAWVQYSQNQLSLDTVMQL